MSTDGGSSARRTSGRSVRRITTGALCALMLAGTAGSVQAGFLDSLFGGRSMQAYPSPGYDSRVYQDYDPYGYPVQRRARRAAPRPVTITPEAAKVEAMCCKNGGDPMKAIFNDPTLVPGDTVMTPQGMRTFRGASAPHSPRDFVDVASSRLVSSAQRKQLLAMDR